MGTYERFRIVMDFEGLDHKIGHKIFRLGHERMNLYIGILDENLILKYLGMSLESQYLLIRILGSNFLC